MWISVKRIKDKIQTVVGLQKGNTLIYRIYLMKFWMFLSNLPPPPLLEPPLTHTGDINHLVDHPSFQPAGALISRSKREAPVCVCRGLKVSMCSSSSSIRTFRCMRIRFDKVSLTESIGMKLLVFYSWAHVTLFPLEYQHKHWQLLKCCVSQHEVTLRFGLILLKKKTQFCAERLWPACVTASTVAV